MTVLDVLLPVKNGMPYIRDSIESILSQTFSDFDLFVIDDGSADETRTVVAELAKIDTRIKKVDCAGSGLIDALNQGLELSTSQFIARMDADDISMPTRFERQISYLQSHADVDVVGSWTELIDQAGRSLDMTTRYPISPNEVRQQLFSNRNPLAHPTVMMRSGIVKALGGYRMPLKAAEDFDLWLRVAESGNLANLPEPLLRYRIHPDQVSAAKRMAQSFSSELAFICSEERRADRTDPANSLSKAATWQEGELLSGTPAVTDLCHRFAAMTDVFQTSLCQKERLRFALAQIAQSRLSMAINHRLYADISARIAVQALQIGALTIAFRALFIGLNKNMRRFIKTSLRYFADPHHTT